MATKTSKSCLLLSLVLLVSNCMQLQYYCVHAKPQVACFIIFGGSISDVGNNNNLITTVKSNYRPYGIDFARGPTGRFTNGRTVVDILAQLLEFEGFIPPFANIPGNILDFEGVNYASGGAGIRPESGKHRGDNIDLRRQIINHKIITYPKIVALRGGWEKANEYLSKCLYHVNIGSSDYINNYFLPQIYPTSQQFTLDQYADDLIARLSQNIQDLQDVGARKFALVGLGRLGCTPFARLTNGSCDERLNVASSIFNVKLRTLVDQLNNNLSPINNSNFIFVNTTALRLTSSQAQGFTVTNASCCPTRRGSTLCDPNQTPCNNRSQYVYWDGIRPSDSINQIIAKLQYNGSNPAFTYPRNIKNLIQS